MTFSLGFLGSKWDFTRYLTFLNSSERIIVAPDTGIVSLFNANIPAMLNISSRKYLSSENSRQCLDTYNQELTHSPWSKIVAGDSLTPITDPLGGSAAYKFVPNASSAVHFIYQTLAAKLHWFIAKADGYNYALIRLPDGVGNPTVTFNLTTGAVNNCTNPERISSSGTMIGPNGAKVCWVLLVGTSVYTEYGCCEADGTPTFTGDGIKGIDMWIPQVNATATYCGSPIRTVASAVTRAADNGYIAAASVPIALKDKIIARARFNFAGTQTTGKHTLFEFVDTTQNIKCFYDGSDKKVKVAGTLKELTTGCYRVTYDNDYYYFTDYNGGAVGKIAKATGALTVMCTARNYAFGIKVDTTTVFFCQRNAGKICSVPKTGGDPETVEIATGLSSPVSLVLLGSNVYFVDSVDKTLKTVAKTGGTVSTLTTFTNTPYAIDTDGTWLYVACQGATNGLTRIKPDGSDQQCIDSNCRSTVLKYIDGYCYYGIESLTELYKINTTTLATTKISTVNGGSTLDCDGVNAYFRTTSNTIGSVSVNGGTVTTITPAMVGTRGMVVDGSTLVICDFSGNKMYSIFKAPFSSAATTHSALQEISAALDRVAGTMTLAGFTTGNGATTGTPWNRTDGNLLVGQSTVSGENADGFVHIGILD